MPLISQIDALLEPRETIDSPSKLPSSSSPPATSLAAIVLLTIFLSLLITLVLLYCIRLHRKQHKRSILTRLIQQNSAHDIEKAQQVQISEQRRTYMQKLGSRLSRLSPISLSFCRLQTLNKELLPTRASKRRWRVVRGKLISVHVR